MDITGIKGAVDELTKDTLPELIAELNKLLDRAEGLLDRLNGTSAVLMIPPKK
jgi:hypothetical protein